MLENCVSNWIVQVHPTWDHFRMGSRIVKASPTHITRQVYRLQLTHPTVFDLPQDSDEYQDFCRIAHVDCLPTKADLLNHLRTDLPEWFLPLTVIIKRMKHDIDDMVDFYQTGCTSADMFKHEKEAYERLKPVQGTAVPVYYGEAEYAGRRALVLSDLGNKSFDEAPGYDKDIENVITKIEAPFRALASCGVSHGNPDLHNLMLVDGESRIMIVDFELASLNDSLYWSQSQCRLDAQECYGAYRHYRNILLRQHARQRMSEEEKEAERKEYQEADRRTAEFFNLMLYGQ